MNRLAIPLAALLLLSGCCGLSQFAEAYERQMAMDHEHVCGPSTNSKQMDFYNCDYLKAEGSEVHVSLSSAYLKGVESVDLGEAEIYSAIYFRKAYGALEAETYLRGAASIATGNKSVDIEGMGGVPLNCTFTGYSLDGRYLNLTAACDRPIPADRPTTYMLFSHVPIVFGEDAPEDYKTLALTDSRSCTADECKLRLYIIAERR